MDEVDMNGSTLALSAVAGLVVASQFQRRDSTFGSRATADHYVVLYFDEDTGQWETTDRTRGWDLIGDAPRVLDWARANVPRPRDKWGQIRLKLVGKKITLDAQNDGTRPLLPVEGSRALDLDALMAAHSSGSPKPRRKSTSSPSPKRSRKPSRSSTSSTRAVARRVYLENTKGTSNKFWEGWTEGSVFYARWGKIGTSGTSDQWPMASPQAAQKKLAAKVKEKQRKSYAPV